MGRLSKKEIGKLVGGSMEKRFRATGGTGIQSHSFEKRLYKATKFGELKNLRDNTEAIMKVVKKRQKLIRRGRYDRRAKREDFQEILKSGNVTREDKREIRKLLASLSEGTKAPTIGPLSKNASTRKELPEFLKNRYAQKLSDSKNMPYKPNANTGGISGNRNSNLPISSNPKPSSNISRPKLVK
ncbi:hypothetical protein HN670_01220 [bacterium]|jgi:hypothetical protein|nr:hypothetical protein [bacterium]MBT4648909.1 hypothetical protein [bacterium]MBT7553073.1 hypothetical protein [bacterium]